MLEQEGVLRDLYKKITVDKLTGDDYCQAALTGYVHALESTLQWAEEQGKSNQVKTADADEEGHFRMVGLAPGRYILVVSGQAGVNSAFWEKGIIITAGQTTAVKLSSPKQACLQQ